MSFVHLFLYFPFFLSIHLFHCVHIYQMYLEYIYIFILGNICMKWCIYWKIYVHIYVEKCIYTLILKILYKLPGGNIYTDMHTHIIHFLFFCFLYSI